MASTWSILCRIAHHHWHRVRSAIQGAIPTSLQERLEQEVAASEQRHSGQIRICVESGATYGARPVPGNGRSRCSANCVSGIQSTTTAYSFTCYWQTMRLKWWQTGA